MKVNGLTVGKGAGTNNSTNTAIGNDALYSNQTGDFNTAIGRGTLGSNTSGYMNTAIGTSALGGNTEGFFNTATGGGSLQLNTTGVNNTATGANALAKNMTGQSNTAHGASALYNNTGGYNTATGTNALGTNTTGANNTAIGYNADVATAALTNATAIGAGAIVSVSNTIQLGADGTNGTTPISKVKTSGTITAGAVTYPNTHNSTAGQVLTTDASGVASWNTGHYLGEAFNGGIIFYLYKGSDGLEHGLIVALTETTAKWQTTSTLIGANRTEDGAYNTTLMTNSPAATYIADLGAGWYLPSIDELALLYHNRYSAQKGLRAGSSTLLSHSNNSTYWSSTEYNATRSDVFYFYIGDIANKDKTSTAGVRGVRAF